MRPEIHLFLIWHKAYAKLPEIAQDVARRFEVVKQLEITWSADRFSENLTQLYGTRLPPNSFKEKHCGTGPFTVIIVRDAFPEYQSRITSKGVQKVNVRMFDAKMQYRSWTGGGHKIHATNSVREAAHDLMLLLGKTAAEVEQESWDDGRDVAAIARDPEGASGWGSLTHLFLVLNATVNYVVLRNHEGLDGNKGEDGDIDVLTDDPEEFQFLTKAERIYVSRRRSAFRLKVDNRYVPFDVRFCGDNYYDKVWQQKMLANRMRVVNGPYILDPKDYFYSLLYHALIHKRSVSDVYRERLKTMAGEIGVRLPEFEGHEEQWKEVLVEFLRAEDYSVTIPKDYSVFFNRGNVAVFRRDIVTEVIRAMRAGLQSIENGLR